jgi:transposase-like protein
MGIYTKVSASAKARAVEQVRAGAKVVDVAYQLHVHPSTVNLWTKDSKLFSKAALQELKTRAVILAKSGVNLNEVAKEISVPVATVKKWLNQAGITTNRLDFSDLREVALEAMNSGKSAAEVSTSFGIPRHVLRDWIRLLEMGKINMPPHVSETQTDTHGLDARRNALETKYPPELMNRVVEAARAERNISKVAQNFGIPKSTVQGWVHRNPERQRRGRRYSSEFKMRLVKEVTDLGRSISDVALDSGIPDQTLRNWVDFAKRSATPVSSVSQSETVDASLHHSNRKIGTVFFPLSSNTDEASLHHSNHATSQHDEVSMLREENIRLQRQVAILKRDSKMKREAFERWYVSQYFFFLDPNPQKRFVRKGVGYVSPHVQARWEGWDPGYEQAKFDLKEEEQNV